MTLNWQTSRIHCTVDLDRDGKQIGDLRLRPSDNVQPLGYWPIPIAVIANGKGPTVLLSGGVHGDEFEGPIALMKLMHRLDPADIRGRIIILPALNAPALFDSARVSPIDGGNLNRSFPGARDGGPTAMIAHLIEELILPSCNAAIDLHAGGKASIYAPTALARRTQDPALFAANIALARAFGAPFIWAMGALSDDRSVNAAAARKGIPMIAAELGGGGAATPELVRLAEDGIVRCLADRGILASAPPSPGAARIVEFTSPDQTLFAMRDGLFEPAFAPGDEVRQGARAGAIHSIHEP